MACPLRRAAHCQPAGTGNHPPSPETISVTGWGLAYGHIAVITLMGLFILRKLDRIER